MSTKPSQPFIWDSNNSNSSPITGGHQTDGFSTGSIVVSAELNWIFNLVGRWTQWLSDGDLTVNGLVTPPTFVTLPSGTTNDFDLTPLAGKLAVSLTGGGSNATITGIKSTSAEDGRQLWLTNETGSTVTLSVEDAGSSAANRIDCSNATSGAKVRIPPKGTVVLVYTDPPTGRWAVRAANFAIDFSSRQRCYGPYTWREIGGSNHIQNTGFVALAASTDPLIFPLVVEPNITITGWSIYLDKTSGSGQTLTGACFKFGMIDGTATQVGTNVANSAASPGFVTLTASGLSEGVLADFQYYLRLVPNTPVADDLVYGYSYTYVRGT